MTFDTHKFTKQQIIQFLCKIKFITEVDFEYDDYSLPLPTYENLATIMNLLVRNIPFGVLSLHYFQTLTEPLSEILDEDDPYTTRGISVNPESIYQKVVVKGWGGYCLEKNVLLKIILQSLNYDIIYVATRCFDFEKFKETRVSEFGGINHLVLVVNVDDRNYLVDAGIGGFPPTLPVNLDGKEYTVSDNGVIHRVKVTQGVLNDPFQPTTYNMQAKIVKSKNGETNGVEVDSEEGWMQNYYFHLTPSYHKDVEIINYYVTHNSTALFKRHILMSLFVEGGTIRMVDNKLKIEINGNKQTLDLNTEDERKQALKNYFDIELPISYKEVLPPKFGKFTADS